MKIKHFKMLLVHISCKITFHYFSLLYIIFRRFITDIYLYITVRTDIHFQVQVRYLLGQYI